MKSSNNNGPQAVSENLVIQKLGDELLVYNLATQRVMSLNTTVACVWELCDGNNSVAALREKAERTLKSAVPEEAVRLALDELDRHGLLVKNTHPAGESSFISDISRRAMIRRIGLSAALAIPVITAVTAPSAAQSSSNLLPDGEACATNEQCVNTCCVLNVCRPETDCFI